MPNKEMYTQGNDDTDRIEHIDLNIITKNDDQQQLTPTFERIFSSHQRYNELRHNGDAIKERFNGLQSKLQELDVLRQPSFDLYRTITPSSRDSGIPIPSSSSSCCSSISESTSPIKSSLEFAFDQQESGLEFFLHPPNNNSPRVSVHLNEKSPPMSYASPSRYPSHGRSVHWNDQPNAQQSPPSKKHIYKEDDHYNFNSAVIKKRGPRISVSASLPFHSKLNIRVNANKSYPNVASETNKLKATATIQRLDPRHEHEFVDALRRSYAEHYSTISPNESISTARTRTTLPVYFDKLPRHRQVSLPVSLPIDQRLCLYIRNGEILARC